MPAILGKKMRMTQVWKDGKIVPVTLVSAMPNEVSIVRTKERDGYEAAQIKLGKHRKEFILSHRTGEKIEESLREGDSISVSAFTEGDKIRVTGIMKGRGFQGGVKRHGFHGGPKTHGQKNRHRAPGSIGSTAPQRVWKGRRMAGHMGMTRTTITNLRIVGVDADKNILMIKGAIPGATGSVVEIQTTGKKK
jgi:large subunit ribosomal protein L3